MVNNYGKFLSDKPIPIYLTTLNLLRKPGTTSTILMPSAARLRVSLTSSSGRAKKSNFHWLKKMDAQQKEKLQSTTHSILPPFLIEQLSLTRFSKNLN